MTKPDPRAVGDVVEQLLTAYQRRDTSAMAKALQAPVLQHADAQHRGLGNLHLAFAFARLLQTECPPTQRDASGVPRLDLLVGDGIDPPGYLDARIAVGEELDQPVSRPEIKASTASSAQAIPLVQRFIRTWVLSPQAVPTFVQAQSARSAAMIDEVWGMLFEACARVRAAE